MKVLLNCCFAFVLAIASQNAFAETYPSRTVEIVTAYGAGGTVDLVARVLAENLDKALKGNFIVTYKLGASGTIAAGSVAKSAPDGYTLFLAYTNELAISPALMQTTYSVKDFEPIAFLGSTPFVLIGQKNLSATNFKGLLQLASKPEGLTFASAGYGSLPQIAGELLKRAAKVNLRHVPYKGGPAAIGDLLGGHVDLYFSGIPGALGQINHHNVKAFAVTGTKRVKSLPDIPTLQEAGVNEFSDLVGWFVLLAPKGTPKAVIDKLRTSSIAALKQSDTQETFETNAITADNMSRQALAKYIADQSNKYQSLLKQLNIRTN